jgi:hypothetical protein
MILLCNIDITNKCYAPRRINDDYDEEKKVENGQ